MKKIFTLTIAVLMGVLTFSSCEKDDTNNPSDDSKYKDKTFGMTAIGACANIVSELDNANKAISMANLTTEQETYLRNVLNNIVNNVIIPTYTDLANDVEDLEKTLNGLTVNNITQAQINKACEDFKNARQHWERSEAFLGGPASDFDIDPTIDSWPLNRTLLVNYFNKGMDEDMLDDQSILGFHALEFILFRDGQPRKVSELQGKDTYKRFENITGAQELAYAQTICKLLKERCFQLQVSWEGEKNANRVAVVKAANLEYTTENGLNYGENLTSAGINSKSTFPTLKAAISQILNYDEGSAAAIATEVGAKKIANPFANGDISYVESPYSYNSISDFQDNIRSIRNIWYGSTTGNPVSVSFNGFFNSISNGNIINKEVVNAIETTITKIGEMPNPFVKYCCTIWGVAFEDDEDWEVEE
jgi:hypothetical protein